MNATPGLVTIVVPAKDEEAAIGRTLRALPKGTLRAAGFSVEVVVLDGSSGDATRRIAKRHGARIIGDAGRGKGRAFRGARPRLRGEFIVMLDADGSYATDAIPRLLDTLRRGDADIVMGRRTLRPGSMTGLHRVGNALLSAEASLLYARRCHDLCTGLWGFRAGALQAMPLRSKGFELEAELFATASRLGLRIEEVPVDYLPRGGQAKLSAGRDGLRIGWCLLATRFTSMREPRPQARALPTPEAEVER